MFYCFLDISRSVIPRDYFSVYHFLYILFCILYACSKFLWLYVWIEKKNFIKKRLQHRYFSVNIAKCLRTSPLAAFECLVKWFTKIEMLKNLKNLKVRIVILTTSYRSNCLQIFCKNAVLNMASFCGSYKSL